MALFTQYSTLSKIIFCVHVFYIYPYPLVLLAAWVSMFCCIGSMACGRPISLSAYVTQVFLGCSETFSVSVVGTTTRYGLLCVSDFKFVKFVEHFWFVMWKYTAQLLKASSINDTKYLLLPLDTVSKDTLEE